MQPTAMQAVGMGARAAARRAWLLAPALLVALLRAALLWAAPAFLLGMARAGLAAGLASSGGNPAAAIAGALEAVTAPRTLFIAAGLFLGAVLAAAALRVAFLSGALPTLAEELARTTDRRPRFAQGLAFRFAPLVCTALLGLALEVAASLYAATAALAAILVGVRSPGGGRAVTGAVLGAGALTSAVVVYLLAGLVVDAALARTAVAGDGPATALAQAFRRVLRRPAAFLLAALALGVASLALAPVTWSAQGVLLAADGSLPVALAGRLLAAAVAGTLAAFVELWRLAAVTALACAEDPA